MTETLIPNVERLDSTLTYIKAHPERWNQKDWRCSSGMCFAGWGAVLAGAKFTGDALVNPSQCDWDGFTASMQVLTPDGRLAHVWDFAREVFGITFDESIDLFSAFNTLDDIECAIARIKAGELR